MGGILVRHAPESASEVRRRLALDLHRHGIGEETIDDVTLIASELIGNAIRHCSPAERDGLEFAWQIDPDAIEISVADPSDELPVLRNPAPDSPSGRGLAIVAALATDWGVEPSSRGKRVWARVRVGA
jgi:anti-sigma regulatory factor (Ser/Thr protein kinase)